MDHININRDDELLIDLDYIEHPNKDEHLLDEHSTHSSSENTHNSINNQRIQPSRRNQHNQHNQNDMSKKIFTNTCYISLLASIGLWFNIVSYNDITTINSADNINFNFNITNAYYYILISLAFYACYIGITILIFVCAYFININKITIVGAINTNNVVYSCIILLRIIQFYIFSTYILNDTYILQVNTTNTTNNIVNVYIPLYIELGILDTILNIFIFYMIGKTYSIITMYYNFTCNK